MFLHIQKDKLDNIFLIDIRNDFVEVNERRQSLLGRFDKPDLCKSYVHTKSVGIHGNMSQ